VVKVPLVLAVGRTGTTAVWWSLTTGEIISAAVALTVLRREMAPKSPALSGPAPRSSRRRRSESGR
jgi:Na+-driven multidrug efflux pump